MRQQVVVRPAIRQAGLLGHTVQLGRTGLRFWLTLGGRVRDIVLVSFLFENASEIREDGVGGTAVEGGR